MTNLKQAENLKFNLLKSVIYCMIHLTSYFFGYKAQRVCQFNWNLFQTWDASYSRVCLCHKIKHLLNSPADPQTNNSRTLNAITTRYNFITHWLLHICGFGENWGDSKEICFIINGSQSKRKMTLNMLTYLVEFFLDSTYNLLIIAWTDLQRYVQKFSSQTKE